MREEREVDFSDVADSIDELNKALDELVDVLVEKGLIDKE